MWWVRLLFAALFGAAAMAYRAYSIAPASTLVQGEMAMWALIGALMVPVLLIVELARSLRALNKKYSHG